MIQAAYPADLPLNRGKNRPLTIWHEAWNLPKEVRAFFIQLRPFPADLLRFVLGVDFPFVF
jgi:hypothetical protein